MMYRGNPFLPRSREKCGRLGNWPCIYWAQNIRQRDIKFYYDPILHKMLILLQQSDVAQTKVYNADHDGLDT
jgi:hypothetical protein